MSDKKKDTGQHTFSWRERRRIRRESRHILREVHRILRRHAARVSDETEQEIREAAADLEHSRNAGEYGRLRRKIERVDRLIDKHFSRYRKSAMREYVESIGIAVLIALLLRAFVVEAFKIPSTSMIPTLKVGDHIFVSKFIYGLRIPWTNIKFFTQQPKRGEVIVFIYPKEPDKDFIKRVVAVGGDTVEVRNNLIYVNGEAVERRRLDEPCRYPDTQEGFEDWSYRGCVLYEETVEGNRYNVVQDADSIPDDFGPFEVPDGYVFVMGDNRDNSHDSRGWGPVPLSYIKGKALIIWWSRGLPHGVRWNRLFDLVHAEGANPSS